MKANELRIGNLVKTKTSESAYNVRELNETLVNLSGTAVHYDHCIPIPLTEEWLLKFGFAEWDNGSGRYYDGRFEIEILTNDKIMIVRSFDESTGKHWHLRDIEYVHQLQNFYFALTGEELEMH